MKTPQISFYQGRETVRVQTDQIIRLEAMSNYTRVYFTDHRPMLMAKVLRAYDEILRPHGFVRAHRSHLINLQYIEGIDANGNIRMLDTSCVETSGGKGVM
jgi:two-component system LytT family response regulator